MKYKDTRKRIKATLTNQEYIEFCRFAREKGLKPTTALKQAAFSYTRQTYLVPARLEERTIALTNLVRNIGSNINQMTRHAHFTGRLQLKAALRRIDELERLIKTYVFNPRKGNDNQINRM